MTEPTQTGGTQPPSASESSSTPNNVSPTQEPRDAGTLRAPNETAAQAPWATQDPSPSPWSRESVSAPEPAQFLAPDLQRSADSGSTPTPSPAVSHPSTTHTTTPDTVPPVTPHPAPLTPHYPVNTPTTQPPYQGYGVPYPASTQTSTTQVSGRRLGVTALWLAISALVIGVILAVVTGIGYGDLILKSGYSPSASQAENEKVLTEYLTQHPNPSLMLGTFGQFIPSVLGIVAIVLGAISLKGGSKAAGVWAIVLSVLAPLVCVVVWVTVATAGVLGR